MPNGITELVYTALVLRVIPILCGFGSICLGFFLFIKKVEGCSSGSGGWGSAKFIIKKAAPGIFFAVLGAAVMISAILRSSIVVDSDKDGKGRPGFHMELKAEKPPDFADFPK